LALPFQASRGDSRDDARLIGALLDLCNLDNTVLVVEHDEKW
jgi:excinuclease UvrABC ATPase subunit